MPSFSDLAGVPMTIHKGLLRGLLRARYGFKGVIVSDFNAIAELIAHGVAADIVEAAALALNAGIDIDMASGAYLAGLPEALSRGLVSEADIDAAVLRVLDLKARLGLFEQPFAPENAMQPDERAAYRALARDAARKSIVLLQNRGGLLPLAKPVKLVVAGPLADAPGEMLGPWHAAGEAAEAVSFLQGLRRALPDWDIAHFEDFAAAGAREAAGKADVLLLCLGETAAMSGEAASRARPGLPDGQVELLKEAKRFGKPIAVALTSGRPIIEPFLFEAADAVLACLVPGLGGGKCARGHPDRQGEPKRQACRHLARGDWPNPDLLRPAPDRPARQRAARNQQISGCPGRAAVPVRAWAVLFAIRLWQLACVAGGCKSGRADRCRGRG